MIGRVEYLKAECDGCGVEFTDSHTDCNDHFPNAIELGEALKDSGWRIPPIHHQPTGCQSLLPQVLEQDGAQHT